MLITATSTSPNNLQVEFPTNPCDFGAFGTNRTAFFSRAHITVHPPLNAELAECL